MRNKPILLRQGAVRCLLSDPTTIQWRQKRPTLRLHQGMNLGKKMACTTPFYILRVFANTQLFKPDARANAAHTRAPGGPGGCLDGGSCFGAGERSAQASNEETPIFQGTAERVDKSQKSQETEIGFLAETTEQFCWFVDWIQQEQLKVILIYQKHEYYFKDGYMQKVKKITQCK